MTGLNPLPGGFVETRDSLHQIAFFAMSPARYRVEERMGLRATPGGFGTPEFDGKIARVEGDMLVYVSDGDVASRTITSIAKVNFHSPATMPESSSPPRSSPSQATSRNNQS